jgi:hypothetical protein
MGIAETRMDRGFSLRAKKIPVIFPVIAQQVASEMPGFH